MVIEEALIRGAKEGSMEDINSIGDHTDPAIDTSGLQEDGSIVEG